MRSALEILEAIFFLPLMLFCATVLVGLGFLQAVIDRREWK